MTSFPGSTSALHFCRGCLGDSRCEAIKSPHNFFECAMGRCSLDRRGKTSRCGKKCGLVLRTRAITEASKKEIRAATTKTAQAKLKSEHGVHTIYPALSEDLIPSFNEHECCPFVRCALSQTLATRVASPPSARRLTTTRRTELSPAFASSPTR